MKKKITSWRCPMGHVIGQVVEQNKTEVLLLYRYAIIDRMDDENQPGEIDIIGTVEGKVSDIHCDICGKIRTWMPGDISLQRLIRSFRMMHYN